jgi:sugar lactone lactonase YvrE
MAERNVIKHPLQKPFAPRRLFASSLVRLLIGAVSIGTVDLSLASSPNALSIPLTPGLIVYADSGNAVQGGFIMAVNPVTHEPAVLASGDLLQMPFDLVFDAGGALIISDSGRLIRIDPDTHAQTNLFDSPQPTLGSPFGIVVDASGCILVANGEGIVQVNPTTHQVKKVSAPGELRGPIAVALANNGDMVVLDHANPPAIVRISQATGERTIITQGGKFKNPQAMAISGNDIYVTDVATPDGNFGVGLVLHVDALNGHQKVAAEKGFLVQPVGIVIEADGQLIVGDPYTVNPRSPDPANGGYDGAIIRINPMTRKQTLICRGNGSAVNPRGVAVVPQSKVSMRAVGK